MSSRPSGKRGRQEPRLAIAPGNPDHSEGSDASELFAAYKHELDPWQSMILTEWAAMADPSGREPVYTECILDCPRQNGKNEVIEAYEFYRLIVCGEAILHTAHQVKTANKSFQKLAAVFSNPANPDVCAMVERIRRTNGEQGIYLTNGGFIEYSARSRGASRGNTYSVVVYDEAQELTDDQVEALMSTISASPTGYRQLIYTGTPPSPSSPGTVFKRVRKAAIDEPCESTCLHEWGVEKPPAQNATFAQVEQAVYESNPAMGVRLDIGFTEKEFRTMAPDGFARERLGWWSESSSAVEIRRSEWDALAVDDPPGDGKTAYGVRFSPDGSAVSLAVCVVPKDGAPHVELVAHRPQADGVTWLADHLAQRADGIAAIAIDGKSGASELFAQLAGSGFPRRAMTVCGAQDVISATTRFHNAVKEGSITHWRDEGQALLDDSATHLAKRKIGSMGGYGWQAAGEAPATPIEAVTLAYWAAMTTKRDLGRKVRLI